MGGVHKERSDGAQSRGDMHILLVGDPGAGKSQLLKRISLIAPKGRYVSGKGVSAAGLTASVVRDEFLRGWSLEAGAMVLASNGLCCIDEMDKMSEEDRSAMHEALENQTVSISKANIQATLLARTTVLAAANPKFGRFDPYDIIAKQIDLAPALINRFDLIFPIKDLPDTVKDEKLASHILNLHQTPDLEEPEIPTDLLRKYVAYAKQKVKPALSDSALEEIKNFFVEIRNKEVGEEGATRAIPISPRQLEALVRLAEACAKIRLSNKVTKKDAKKAIELLQYCLSQVGLDPETGKIDIDRIATGVSASARNKILTIKEIIEDLENRIGKTIPIDDLVKEATAQGISEGDIEDALEKLKRSGDLFEPKRGFISRI
jgi:replicative DNA helicase Mcm